MPRSRGNVEVLQGKATEKERETMKDKDKVIPNLLLQVEWGMQCSRALTHLKRQVDQYRLDLYTDREAYTTKEYKLLWGLLDKVEEWADTGKPWID